MKQSDQPGGPGRWLRNLRDAIFWRDRDLPSRKVAPTVADCQKCGHHRQLFLWQENVLWCQDCIDQQLRGR